jgi:signal transduction histidine kinase
MHDVVAHSISVMVVQAGGARRILEHDPARAVEAGAEIERVGRDALLEMRRLLGALHPREGGPAMAPQPSMADVPALLDRARAAGLPVELHEEGDRRELAAGMDLALYRILQEALTNSLKHSGPAPTDVRLCWHPDAVELFVVDDGPRGNGFVEAQGLIGMRERVRLYGGELACTRRPEGGFRVHARLPFTSQEETV